MTAIGPTSEWQDSALFDTENSQLGPEGTALIRSLGEMHGSGFGVRFDTLSQPYYQALDASKDSQI